jgi:putative FmdB family regulatory protein
LIGWLNFLKSVPFNLKLWFSGLKDASQGRSTVMPLYEFQCETCGPFEQWRTLAEASNPMLCPTCQTAAKRLFSPPSLILTSGTLRVRGEQNSEPQLVKRSQDRETASPKYQSHRHGRPWMIGH